MYIIQIQRWQHLLQHADQTYPMTTRAKSYRSSLQYLHIKSNGNNRSSVRLVIFLFFFQLIDKITQSVTLTNSPLG